MRKALLFVAAFFCAACSNYSANLPSIKPYKMDIQQGNYVTSKMMMQLRPGMTKSQVRFIMGTPLIADSFHADRWDYLYRMAKGGKIIEQRHVIMEFEGDRLKRVRGDVIPAAAGDAAPPETADKMQPKSITPNKPKEKGLLDKLKFWKDDEDEPVKSFSPEPGKEPLKAPAPVVDPAKAEPKAETKAEPAAPAKQETQPVPAEEEKAPAPVAVEPAQPTAEQPKPAPKPAEPAPAKAAPVPAPAEQVKSEPIKAEPAKSEPTQPAKSATAPAEDLPPEDDPGYFERMLEKIGF
jgi:outer membrane protein assembly factor BamE